MGHNTFMVGDKGKLGSRDGQCQPKGEGRKNTAFEVTWELLWAIRAGMPWGRVKLLEY